MEASEVLQEADRGQRGRLWELFLSEMPAETTGNHQHWEVGMDHYRHEGIRNEEERLQEARHRLGDMTVLITDMQGPHQHHGRQRSGENEALRSALSERRMRQASLLCGRSKRE